VILARGISDIGLYNVSDYTTVIMHDGSPLISISLAE
jgi:hypothetical protein